MSDSSFEKRLKELERAQPKILAKRQMHFQVEKADGSGRIEVVGGSPECLEWMAHNTIGGVQVEPYTGPANPIF
jgi:hypothetical protein